MAVNKKAERSAFVLLCSIRRLKPRRMTRYVYSSIAIYYIVKPFWKEDGAESVLFCQLACACMILSAIFPAINLVRNLVVSSLVFGLWNAICIDCFFIADFPPQAGCSILCERRTGYTKNRRTKTAALRFHSCYKPSIGVILIQRAKKEQEGCFFLPVQSRCERLIWLRLPYLLPKPALLDQLWQRRYEWRFQPCFGLADGASILPCLRWCSGCGTWYVSCCSVSKVFPPSSLINYDNKRIDAILSVASRRTVGSNVCARPEAVKYS